jgi:hypothetical protein
VAHIERFGSYVILGLSRKERLFAFHSSPQVKYSDIISIRKVAKVWRRKIIRGLRAPGTGIPYFAALGTWRMRRGKNFVVVYRKRPAYVFTFGASEFNQWIVTPDNSAEEMASLFPEVLSE